MPDACNSVDTGCDYGQHHRVILTAITEEGVRGGEEKESDVHEFEFSKPRNYNACYNTYYGHSDTVPNT